MIFEGIVKFRVFFQRDFEFLYVLAKSRPDPMGFNVFYAGFCILFDIVFNFYFLHIFIICLWNFNCWLICLKSF